MKNKEITSNKPDGYYLTEEQEAIFKNMVDNDASVNELIELLEGFIIEEYENKGE